MARPRKTAAQLRQESSDADRRAWEQFYPKLTSVQSFREALVLVGGAVAPNTPGRRFYSNLGFFLQTFAPPAGAGGAELREYLRLIGVFDAEGVLKPGARAEVEEHLRGAMAREAYG